MKILLKDFEVEKKDAHIWEEMGECRKSKANLPKSIYHPPFPSPSRVTHASQESTHKKANTKEKTYEKETEEKENT